MATLVSKIEFPRSSPDNLITMSEKLIGKHYENPKAVSIAPEKTEILRANIALAKQKREEAKAFSERAIKLNGEADKILGIAIGQTLEDETTIAGGVSLFSKYAQLDFKGDLEKLKDYGFTVTLSIKAQRPAKPKVKKGAKKKE